MEFHHCEGFDGNLVLVILWAMVIHFGFNARLFGPSFKLFGPINTYLSGLGMIRMNKLSFNVLLISWP